MSFNGSGTFVINSAGQPVVANTVISATVFNALTSDLATGLSTCITKDGQTTVTANIPFGSNKITGLGAGTVATDAANLGQVQSTAAKLISVTGTDTITGTMSPVLTAYAAGQLFYFISNGTNTGAMTINIDGLGAKAITRDGSTALIAGDVVSGEIVVICYDGTRFQMINAANSFGNTTINGTLTVTGDTALQANVSVTSALTVNGTFGVTGAATLGSTLSVAGKSDLPTVSTASMNAAVAVVTTGTVTNLTSTSASIASMNAGVALLTTATVTTLTASGASIASANIGNLQFTAASIASINAGVAVINNLTATSASIASMNGSVANITTVNATTVDATNVEVTNVKAKDGTAAIVIDDLTGKVNATTVSAASLNAAVAVITTGTVTNLTSTSASVASANAGVALITTGTVTNLTSTSASIASANVGTAVITTGTLTNLTATSASVASANLGVALVTTGTVTNLTSTGASIASANLGNAVISSMTLTGASVASVNVGTATITGNLTLSGGTANGVLYLNGSKVATSGSALTFDGTNFATTGKVGAGASAGLFMQMWSTGNIMAADGSQVGFLTTSAGAPTNYMTGSAASNYLAWVANNAEQMRLTSTGLGIGTSSPDQKLVVSGQQRILSASQSFTSAGKGLEIFYNSADDTGYIQSYDRAGGSFKPLKIRASTVDFTSGTGANTLTFDASGNLGLGVTPSAWASFKALQVGEVGAFASADFGGSNVQAFLGNNVYYGTNFKYIKSNVASIYRMVGKTHAWSYAEAGTAGNDITFTQAMTLDASGNLLVGLTTSPSGGGAISARATTGTHLFDTTSGTEVIGIKKANGNTAYLATVASNDSSLQIKDSGGTVNLTVGTSGNSLALKDATPQSGVGITFPATQVASSNANTLDDYEEGTWTPTDNSGAGLTITVNGAQYTKIGRTVTINFEITFPSTANGNNVSVSLPFTPDSANRGGLSAFSNRAGETNIYILNNANFNLYDDTGNQLTNANMSTKYLIVSITYFV